MSGREPTIAERLDPEKIWARWNNQPIRRPGPGRPLRPYAGDEQPAEASQAAHQRAIKETAARDELLRRVHGENQDDE